MRRPAEQRRGAALASVVLLLSIGGARPAAADEEPAARSAATVEAERRQVTTELEDIDEGAPGATERRKLLERLDRHLLQQLDELSRADDIADEVRTGESEIDEIAGREPPFDLATYDAAADAADRSDLLVRRLERARTDASATLDAAKDAFEEAETRRRRAKDDIARRVVAAEETLRLREIESRVTRAAVQLRTLELQNAKSLLEANRAMGARLRAVHAAMAEQLVLRPEDLRTRTEAFEEEREAVRRRMREARRAIGDATARLRAAEAEVNGRGDAPAALRGRIGAARAERSALQRSQSVLAERLDRLDRLETWEERRFRLLTGGVPRSELQGWLGEVRDDFAGLDREESLKLAEAAEVERELARLRAEDAPASPSRTRQVGALERLADLYREDLAHLGASRDRGRRLLDDLATRIDTWTVRERAELVRDRLGAVWRYEITTSDDRPITVGKVVRAILVFAVGWLVARLLAMLFGRRALPRLGFDPGAANAFESLGFYALLVVAFLVALRMVNIPLTAFAVAGGALAIGVGFGSQNVVSNFISGLILLAERPIKIGDLVELEGTYGNVERIGLRSTRVRTGSNVHVIVPNAMFLENRVINWTHNDPQVRIVLTVGVTYGSPTRDVERILREVLVAHPRVLPLPPPKVLFMEFGDSALNFECHFWIEMRVYMDRREIESELRYAIDDHFRAAGIVIAFPQRDVHLDTLSPLAVRLVPDGEGGGAS